MELKPRTKSQDFQIQAYGSDVKQFKEFVGKLNEGLKQSSDPEGEYSEEDVFSHILSVFFDAKPEYRKLLKTDGRTTRHREKNPSRESNKSLSGKGSEKKIKGIKEKVTESEGGTLVQ